jgi:predicted Zn finger-like uncharacterized protein
MAGAVFPESGIDMAGTTTCPQCGTRFRISREQLEMHHGMVRCGNCLTAFDTRPHFAPEEIDPQLVLPILDDAYGHASAYDDVEIERPTVAHNVIDPVEFGIDSAPATTPELETPQTEKESPAPAVAPDADETPFLAERKSRFWGVASFLLGLALALQALYLFRIELAARIPALRPNLEAACKVLGCTVPLPQNADLMTIESSELKDEPGEGHQILLTALLRNRADYVQAYPKLELTLTDFRDVALARRVFKPAEYLASPGLESGGLAANRELSVRLRLDTTNLNPVGYRLALLY